MNNQRQRKNKFGLPGVLHCGRRFASHIKTNGKIKFLGVFDTPEAASLAYQKAKQEKIAKLEKTP